MLLYDVSHLLEVLIRDGTDLVYLAHYGNLNFISISCGCNFAYFVRWCNDEVTGRVKSAYYTQFGQVKYLVVHWAFSAQLQLLLQVELLVRER